MKILAVKLRRLGDTVLWTAALDALRAWHPHAEIDIAFPAPYAPLFQGDPRFTHRFALDGGRSLSAPLARELRGRRYEWVLVFHAGPQSRSVARTARGKVTVIHHHSRRPKRFGSDLPVVDVGKPMPAIERDLNVLRTLGWAGEARMPRVLVPPVAEQQWEQRIRGAFEDPDKPLVLLGPGASRPAKRWPLERYEQLARMLAPEARVGVICESRNEFDRVRGEALSRAAVPFPTPHLRDLVGLLAQAKCFVGSDSGVKHIAAAVGVPTVTLFGPESLGEWHCYPSPKHRALQKAVACRDRDPHPPEFAWCGAEVCPLASHACMTRISVTEVAATVWDQLGHGGRMAR